MPSERLLAAGLEEWMGVPLWIASPGWRAANRVVVSKAIAAGREWPRAEIGISPELEQELFAG